uniref:THAP domain-containing protein 1 n=1 Tax=Oryzias melastigma TaxID=30732 RepID=A0A3B3CPX6_ORYME
MVKRCVVMFCRNSLHTGHSVHVFPKNPVLRRQWIRFVEVKRANFKLTKNSVICGAHFEKECMMNALQIAMGYSVRTLLSPDAVPTIQPTPTEEQMAKARRRASKSKRPPDSQATTSTIQAKVPRRSRAVEKREIMRTSVLKWVMGKWTPPLKILACSVIQLQQCFQPLRNLLSPACRSSHSVQSVFHRQHHQTLTLRTTRLTSPLQRPERRKQISQKSKFLSQYINFMMYIFFYIF